jgi:hypothetical protein
MIERFGFVFVKNDAEHNLKFAPTKSCHLFALWGLPLKLAPHPDQSSSKINLHRGNGISRQNGGNLGEAVARERAGGFEAGRAGEGRFDRKRHLFLDLNRQERRSDGVNLDLDIGHVRHGIDRGGGDSCSASTAA